MTCGGKIAVREWAARVRLLREEEGEFALVMQMCKMAMRRKVRFSLSEFEEPLVDVMEYTSSYCESDDDSL